MFIPSGANRVNIDQVRLHWLLEAIRLTLASCQTGGGHTFVAQVFALHLM